MATFGENGRLEDDWVYLVCRSARQDGASPLELEPVIDLVVMPFNSLQMVKRRIKEKWPLLKAVPDQNIRLLHKGLELRSCFMIADYNVEGGTRDQPVQLQYLIIDQNTDSKGISSGGSATKSAPQGGNSNIGLYMDAQVPNTKELRELVEGSLVAMLSGIQPKLTEEGTGATYMLRDTSNRQILAVFKPKDEEAFAPQNPRGYVGKEDTPGLRSGVLSTQQAAREVAANLLDHEKFANVPETTLAHAKHPKFSKVRGKNGGEKNVWKIGAFQEFVETKDTSGNFAPQVFSAEDIHRIGILDIRIVNLDRNDGNLLVRHGRTSRYELVPIDHGLSLPDRLEVYIDDIAWMGWPQAQKPFGDKELDYIRRLNAQRDARQLAKCLGVRRECLRLMEVTTTLLQLGAEHGLTLFEIGSIMYREDRGIDAPVQKSKLEQIVSTCLDAALTVAGDKGVADLVSSTLAGLDLAPSAGSKLVRQSTGNTPLLGPNSPVFSPPSPGGGPAGMFEVPPPFTLDPHSESDQENDDLTRSHYPSGTFARQLSGDEGMRGSAQESPPPGTPMQTQHSPTPKPKHTTGQSYRGGTKLRQRTSAALAALHREEGDKSTEEGAIFARAGLRGSDWSSELEAAFRRQIVTQLTSYLRKHYPEAAAKAAKARELRAERVAATAAAGQPPAGPAASPPSKVMSAKREDICLADALPKVMPDEGPWLRGISSQASRTESAAPLDTGEVSETAAKPAAAQKELAPTAPAPPKPAASAAPVASEAEPPKRKYIPPQLRKRMEREAQEAREAAEAAAAAAAGK